MLNLFQHPCIRYWVLKRVQDDAEKNMIKADKLTKIFTSGDQKIVALDALTFSVPEGQFLTVTGKSGSGKSTLLYQLGLLDLPTSGEVRIDGTDMVPVSENERTMARLNDLGYIFQ